MWWRNSSRIPIFPFMICQLANQDIKVKKGSFRLCWCNPSQPARLCKTLLGRNKGKRFWCCVQPKVENRCEYRDFALCELEEMAYGIEIETAEAKGLSLLHDLAWEFPGFFFTADVLQRLENIVTCKTRQRCH